MKKALLLVLAVIFLLACGISSEQMTATAVIAKVQTQTAAPTLTPTFTPTATSTPRPTATPKPTQTPTSVPVAIGGTIKYNDLEITLLKVLTHPQVVVSSHYYLDAKDGYIFIDALVLVRNRGDSASGMTMGEIYVTDEDGKIWMPSFGGSQTVKLEKSFNPMTIIKWNRYSGSEVVTFESKKDTYLRLIWPVREYQNLLFGIRYSPQFAFSIK